MPVTTGRSCDPTAVTSTSPIPGREKIASTMTAPEIVAPSAQPVRVRAGRTAWRRTCRRRTLRSPTPRSRALRTNGWSQRPLELGARGLAQEPGERDGEGECGQDEPREPRAAHHREPAQAAARRRAAGGCRASRAGDPPPECRRPEPSDRSRGPRPAVRVTQTTMMIQDRTIADRVRARVAPSCSAMMSADRTELLVRGAEVAAHETAEVRRGTARSRDHRGRTAR